MPMSLAPAPAGPAAHCPPTDDATPREACAPRATACSAFAIEVCETVLRRARAGEREAFEQLYRQFERPVYTLAVRMLGDAHGDGRADAAEVLQDTMLKVFRSLHEFRGDASPFWGWLRRIAVNETLMRLRSRRRHALDVALEDEGAFEDDAPPPPAAADASRLQRALTSLPPVTRSVLWLYHGEGYTHEEIAALMQRTPSFSKSQLARGTRRLRIELSTDSDDAAKEVSDGR